MAVDHVRDFMVAGGIQNPMTDPDVAPALFLKRWITHFCAPVFVTLAGTSAGLTSARKPAGELAALLDFMNCSKYPPSLLYLLITLGSAAAVCSHAAATAEPAQSGRDPVHNGAPVSSWRH